MTVDTAFSNDQTHASSRDAVELKERMIALSERICALAEAANIVAEAAAPFKLPSLATTHGARTLPPFTSADGVNAFDQASRRLEAARLDAVDEFTSLRAKLNGEGVRLQH
jgi:hypothetical protein